MEGAAPDDYDVQANVIPTGLIRSRRADVAAYIVRLAEGHAWMRRTPTIARKEDASASSPRAVLEEMLR